MTIWEMTTIILIKSLWWIIPMVGGIVGSAIMEWKEEHD